MRIQVENVPPYAEDYEFFVARPVDGLLWFWGAYRTESKAYTVAQDVEGVVVENVPV